MKKNFKNKIRKITAGALLACSLLAFWGNASNGWGIATHGGVIIMEEDRN